MSDFWGRVRECDHDNLNDDYDAHVRCTTPYCSGYERHCLDCGVYIQRCKCGYNDGLSGWPAKRWWKRQWKETLARRHERYQKMTEKEAA